MVHKSSSTLTWQSGGVSTNVASRTRRCGRWKQAKARAVMDRHSSKKTMGRCACSVQAMTASGESSYRFLLQNLFMCLERDVYILVLRNWMAGFPRMVGHKLAHSHAFAVQPAVRAASASFWVREKVNLMSPGAKASNRNLLGSL